MTVDQIFTSLRKGEFTTAEALARLEKELNPQVKKPKSNPKLGWVSKVGVKHETNSN